MNRSEPSLASAARRIRRAGQAREPGDQAAAARVTSRTRRAPVIEAAIEAVKADGLTEGGLAQRLSGLGDLGDLGGLGGEIDSSFHASQACLGLATMQRPKVFPVPSSLTLFEKGRCPLQHYRGFG